MLIIAFVSAKMRNKSIRQKNTLPQTALQPLIINSDSRHWLPTQVRSSHNVLGYSCTVQVRHVPSSRQTMLLAGRRKIAPPRRFRRCRYSSRKNNFLREPCLSSCLMRNTTESSGGLNRKSTARVPFFVLQNTAFAAD